MSEYCLAWDTLGMITDEPPIKPNLLVTAEL